ncbi:MAG: hypothetical protein KAS32_20555 [Candidatus Peribacteraceae bacterium]|nr:hypothetical protein [Candidatus Peribacteraceae bacterium]
MRNAIALQKSLTGKDINCKLIDLDTEIDVTEQWDIILFSYATMRANFDHIEQLINNQKDVKIGWLTNEFELFANGFVKEHMTFMITNFEEHGIKKAHRHDELLVTNLNTLLAKPRNPYVPKKYDTCYYGTYRKYREDYFRKYFIDDMILSTSKKNWKTFIDIEASCKVTDKLAWDDGRETLNLFKSSLYIEDTKTHDCFNHLANRFFEGLYCNTPLFFDRTCQNTIDKDQYQIDDYFMIDSYEELMDKTNNLDTEKVNEFLYLNTTLAIMERHKTIEDIKQFLLEI